MTIFQARGAAEAAGLQFDEPCLLQTDIIFEGGDVRDIDHVALIWGV